jgi:two-component system, OmpR family, sensor histidine kinase MtrB
LLPFRERRGSTRPALAAAARLDGLGAAGLHLPHVLERFREADSARVGAGSGLGLAIALENARLLGGNIPVSSDVQRGSVFWLVLPLGSAGDVSGL